MLIAKDFIYLELQKTGGTHIRRVLKDLVGGEIIGKHNRASSTLFATGKPFLGSIRDPWEWYLSLWAYGCDQKGEIFKQLTRPKVKPTRSSLKALEWRRDPYATLLVLLSDSARNPEQWQKTYQDVNDAGAFRDWLHMIHAPSCVRGLKSYGHWPMNHSMGLLTFRYLKLYCTRSDQRSILNQVSTRSQAVDYESKHCFVESFIRNEALESNLFDFLNLSGIAISSAAKEHVISRPRTNSSSSRQSAKFYYDTASERLIGDRDKLIVDKFGYVPPSLKEQLSADSLQRLPLTIG